MADLLDKLGIYWLCTRRLVPIGRGSSLKQQLLSPLELKEFYLNVKKIIEALREKRSRLSMFIGCESGMFNEEISPSDKITKYYCGVVDGRVLIVMPNGDVMPCRRLPIVTGNVTKQSLFEIWYSNNTLWELRNINNAHKFCQKCHNFNLCFGGAKCATYAYYSKLFAPDAQCWKFSKKMLSNNFFENQKMEVNKEIRLAHITRSSEKIKPEKPTEKKY